jgi:hypothetical protein
MTDRADTVDLDAEREVDLGSAWSRIAARWWLPVAGLVVGAVLGTLVALGGGDVYQARTLLYLGQPFTPGGGSQIVSLQTNPKAVSEIIRSAEATLEASKASGLTSGQLRGNVTSAPIVQLGQIASRTLSPLVEIVVRAPKAVQAEKAAASYTDTVISDVGTFVASKTKILVRDAAETQAAIDTAEERIEQTLEQQRRAQANTSLSLAERLLIQANVNSALQFYESRINILRAELRQAEQLISMADQVEKPRVVKRGLGQRTDATSRRNAAAVGALLGLLVGLVAAYLWEPFAARRKERASD